MPIFNLYPLGGKRNHFDYISDTARRVDVEIFAQILGQFFVVFELPVVWCLVHVLHKLMVGLE